MQQGEDESMRVVNSGSLDDCQNMTCEELANNSTPVQIASKGNKESALVNWAITYRRLSSRNSNDPKGDKEFEMSLYTGELIDENDNSLQVFAEGETISGQKGIDGISLTKSKSPIAGWEETETIHTHRWGSDSGNFSDDPGFGGRYLRGDIQTSLERGNPLYLVVPNSNWIGSFSPATYNRYIQNRSHDSAKRSAINKYAIKIK